MSATATVVLELLLGADGDDAVRARLRTVASTSDSCAIAASYAKNAVAERLFDRPGQLQLRGIWRRLEVDGLFRGRRAKVALVVCEVQLGSLRLRKRRLLLLPPDDTAKNRELVQ
eukprot:IDg812t1